MELTNYSFLLSTEFSNPETTFLSVLATQTVFHTGGTHSAPTPSTEIVSSAGNLFRSVVFYIIGFMGMLGNGLVLVVVFRTPSLHDVTNYIIANQSFVDFLSSVLLLFQYGAAVTVSSSSVFADIFCKVWISGYLYWGAIRVSTINLLCLTLDRYYAICHAVKYRNQKKYYPLMLITFSWAFGYMYQFPAFLTRTFSNGECAYVWPTMGLRQAFGISFFLTQWCAPLAIMTFVYLNIARKLRKRVHPQESDNTQQIAGGNRGNKPSGFSERARRNVMKTLMIVSITYAICWGPNFSAYAYFNLGGNVDIWSPLFQFTIMLASSNMSVNPVIYAFKYQRFQAAFCKVFGLKKLSIWLQSNRGAESTSQTRGDLGTEQGRMSEGIA